MNRFEIIASELPDGTRSVYEVGCDHALITRAAFEAGKCERAFASDIRETCLGKARVTLRGYPAECFVYDGIRGDVDADVIIVCGMGGKVISGMIDRYEGGAKLLLSPQKNPEMVRDALEKRGWKITKDRCFEANRRIYDLILAERGEMKLTAAEKKFGAFYRVHNPALKKRIERLTAELGNCPDKEKTEELKEAYKWQK